MNNRSFFSQRFHAPVSRFAAVPLVLLAALAWSTPPAHCGEIHEAARDGDLAKVEALLKNNPSLVFSKDDDGNTPLHWAAQEGHEDVAKFLLTSRADVNAKNNNGSTPLHDAADGGHKDVVELLLANKAAVNAKDNHGVTPLHWAAQEGHEDVAQQLRHHGGVDSAITTQVNAGTAMEKSAENERLLKAAGSGDLATITSLLNKGTDVNAKDDNGQTALMFASSGGHIAVVRALLAKRADVNAKTTKTIITAMQFGFNFSGTAEIYSAGSTALRFACTHGHTAVVQALLGKGADVNSRDSANYTALIDACAYGHTDVVKVLLAKGADVNAKADNGTTALSIASRNHYHEIEEMLTNAGAR